MNTKYAFYQLRVTYRIGRPNRRSQEIKNFDTFDELIAVRHKLLRKPGVINVQTLMVLDEIRIGTEGHQDATPSNLP